jgi:hypothetical protein
LGVALGAALNQGGRVARRTVVVSWLVLVALGLSACGNASANRAPNSSATSPASKVYHLTVNANSADFEYRFAVAPSNSGGTSSTESGAYSWAAHQGKATTQGTAAGLYAMTSKEIVDGNHTYTEVVSKSGPASGSIGLGLPASGWTESKVTGSAPTTLASLFFSGLLDSLTGSALTEPNLVNPADLLAILKADSRTTADLGNEAEGGISTTHYRRLIPFSELVASEGGSPAASDLFGTGKLTLDYWIDSGDRLRMLQAAITIPKLPSQYKSPPSTSVTTTPTPSPGEFKVIQTAPASMASSPPYKFPVTYSVSLRLSNYGTDAQPIVPTPNEVTAHQSCTISSRGYTCQGT